ncbi:MAG TPA: L-histidine N(alpha)-methyltransferase [Longimicrobiales bacterium]|nr:L-histidine N(alpha)-methyltransferase [Longimicrobiales bacterium]
MSTGTSDAAPDAAAAAAVGGGSAPAADEFRQHVLEGLRPGARKLSPKYFYDDVGARLFEEITNLDEYYPTRVETGILEAHGDAMAAAVGRRARIVEFGSGSGDKTRLLLRRLQDPAVYVPVDIACTQLHEFAAQLRAELPSVPVEPVCADYMQPLSLPAAGKAARTVAFFPGSTIGNLEPLQAAAFLSRIARMAGDGGGLLLGTDMHKDTDVLERAYNDGAGVTARFNVNMLERMQRELGAQLDLSAWRHHALYDEANRRIEMRLVAGTDTSITVPAPDGPAEFRFATGEWITTEYSHKYTPDAIRDLAERTGWAVEQAWMDERAWFAVWLLTSTGRH